MKTLRFGTITAALCFWLAALETAWARAGGGGGSHGRGGWLNLIVLPIMLLYSAIITLKVREKRSATIGVTHLNLTRFVARDDPPAVGRNVQMCHELIHG